MAFLVRRIARAKWPEEICEICDLDGDAISDLRTTDNTLSLWYIDDESQLEKAALALAASSKSEKIDSFSVVWMPVEDVAEKGLSIVETDGDTVVSDLIKSHRDLSDVTYSRIGDTAEIILKELISNKHVRRFTRSEIKKVLIDAYNSQRLAIEKCNPRLIEEIQKAINN